MTIVLAPGTPTQVDEIAKRIREILKERGWSERELSVRSGVSSSHVNKILERGGERTAVKTMGKIAKATGVTLDWLANGDGTRAAPPSDRPAPTRATDESDPLEYALGRVFDPDRHTLRDLDGVRTSMRESSALLKGEASLSEMARMWLDAAALLRRQHVPMSTQALVLAISTGKLDAVQRERAERQSADLNAEAAASATAMGLDDVPPLKMPPPRKRQP